MARTGSSPSTSQIVSRRASLFKRHSRTLGHGSVHSPRVDELSHSKKTAVMAKAKYEDASVLAAPDGP